MSIGKEQIGELGAGHPHVHKGCGIDGRVYFSDVEINKLFGHTGAMHT